MARTVTLLQLMTRARARQLADVENDSSDSNITELTDLANRHITEVLRIEEEASWPARSRSCN